MMPKRKRLGRGLEALLGASDEGIDDVVSTAPDSPGVVAPAEDIVKLSVYEIDDNPFQPRRDFSEGELAALSESLKDHDLLQPIVVRVVNGRYQLISGERRLRAAIQAGWTTIPARVRQADDRLVAELAIVENLHRKDLNAIEKALSFRRYIDQHGCTQEDLAKRIKIERSTLTNLIRLLDLPEAVQQAVRVGQISAGHARALLPLGEETLQLDYCKRIQDEQWSVRYTEKTVSEHVAEMAADGGVWPRPARPTSPPPAPNPHLASIEQQLRVDLGTGVEIRQTRRRAGRIVISFSNEREFDRLVALLRGLSNDAVRRAA